MSDLVKVAIAALRKAEVEMRYAGWSVFQSDNIGRFDALKQVLDTIEYLEPFVIKPQGWYKSGESKDYDPKGLHITQTPVPQLATDCTRIMREQGKPYPRTCPRCGLGPCAYIPLTTVQKLSMNQDAAGLLHDKAHTDTGKVRAAQYVTRIERQLDTLLNEVREIRGVLREIKETAK